MQSKLEIDLKENSHYNTINNVFEKLGIGKLGKIQKYMENILIRTKIFIKKEQISSRE